MIIGIDIKKKKFADTEQRTGCKRSTRRLMGSTFVKRHGWETCDILRSALPLALSHKVYFFSSSLLLVYLWMKQASGKLSLKTTELFSLRSKISWILRFLTSNDLTNPSLPNRCQEDEKKIRAESKAVRFTKRFTSRSIRESNVPSTSTTAQLSASQLPNLFSRV